MSIIWTTTEWAVDLIYWRIKFQKMRCKKTIIALKKE